MAGTGAFVWYELMTADAAAAQTFYAEVVGWSMVDSGMPGMSYTLAKVGDHAIAGLLSPSPGMPPAPNRWSAYIGVADVDAMAASLAAAGGTVHHPPSDIPGVGRFAVVADPQGAVFMLFHGVGEVPAPLPARTPGTVGWHELRTSDAEAGFAFYEGLFGWQRSLANDMGPMGIYQTFSIDEVWTGGVMRDPAGNPPCWAVYFSVADIEAATARLTRGGGTVHHGPMEVPGGSWIVIASDPQGVAFALTGPKHA